MTRRQEGPLILEYCSRGSGYGNERRGSLDNGIKSAGKGVEGSEQLGRIQTIHNSGPQPLEQEQD